MNNLLPDKNSVIRSLQLLTKIIIGALIIFPLVRLLPMAGWDWCNYFNNYNSAHNVSMAASVYPPYTVKILSLITWMNWRDSLALLNALTLMVIALATWQQGHSFVAVFLSIWNPVVIMLLWIGHPDGLVLIGIVTGIVPLFLIKPQIAIWNIFQSVKLVFWTGVFILLMVLIYPDWFSHLFGFARGIMSARHILLYKEATFGWAVMGWPIILVGLVLFLLSDSNPFHLMIAGSFLSPYLMPYHFAILSPVIGKTGNKPHMILIWLSSWLVFIGTGLRGYAKLLVLVYPVLLFFLTISPVQIKITFNKRKEVFRYLPQFIQSIFH